MDPADRGCVDYLLSVLEAVLEEVAKLKRRNKEKLQCWVSWVKLWRREIMQGIRGQEKKGEERVKVRSLSGWLHQMADE